jgi:hypothetical protein
MFIYWAYHQILLKLSIYLIKYQINTNFGIHSPLLTKSLVIYFPITNKMFQLIMLKKIIL